MGTDFKAIGRQIPDLSFLEEVYSIPGGPELRNCVQCGTCSGSCPTSRDMDYSPRRIFALTRAGYRDAVLSSKAIWMCVSCYSCYVRCPKDIKITDFFYKLKQLSKKSGYTNPEMEKSRVLSTEFSETVRRYGRNHEMTLLRNFMLKTDPFGAIGNAPLGLHLMGQGRLSIFPKKNKSAEDVNKILDKVNEMERGKV
ncbi:MAG: heterodisulfide reductase [bacterium]|nr:heterodisulfide reductase [bacterium]